MVLRRSPSDRRACARSSVSASSELVSHSAASACAAAARTIGYSSSSSKRARILPSSAARVVLAERDDHVRAHVRRLIVDRARQRRGRARASLWPRQARRRQPCARAATDPWPSARSTRARALGRPLLALDRGLSHAHVRIVQGALDLSRKVRRIFEHGERLRAEVRIGIRGQSLRKRRAQRRISSRQFGARRKQQEARAKAGVRAAKGGRSPRPPRAETRRCVGPARATLRP